MTISLVGLAHLIIAVVPDSSRVHSASLGELTIVIFFVDLIVMLKEKSYFYSNFAPI